MKKHLLLRSVACLLLLVLALSLLVSCGNGTGDNTDKSAEELDADSLEKLLFLLEEVGYFPLPKDYDIEGKTPAELVAATGDRYARYFTAEEYAAYTSDLGGNLVGIGVSITSYKQEDVSGIHILSVFPDSPAAAANLKARDVIIAVDGVNVKDVGYADAIDMVAGDAGTTVSLTYLRDGEVATVDVIRNSCKKQTVHGRVITCGDIDIGYVYITEFDAVTTLQFVNTVAALEAEGIDRILFDLRDNPGGYLHIVCEMLAYALPDGDICSVDYSYKEYNDYTISSGNGIMSGIGSNVMSNGALLPIDHSLEDIPIGVLMDNGTASAAELFISALRDYCSEGYLDVTLFGTETYGKGSMQSSFSLPNGDHVKLTLALYNPPSGVNYNGVGIQPSEGCAVTTPHTSVVPRFFGEYADIAAMDTAMYFALTSLAK